MNRRLLMLCTICAALLAACSAAPPARVSERPKAGAPAPAALAPAPLISPLTLDGYKREFAAQVARASPEVFAEPLPEMLKSVVVLDVTIGHDGKLLRVAVRRSNGFKALEILAMDSVRRAGPYPAPSWSVRRSDGSVNFLETFLFRDDGRFQIRSLVAAR